MNINLNRVFIMRSFKSVLFAVFVAALTVNLVGCKDDDDDKTVSEKIVGTWNNVDYPEEIIVFNADGTGIYKDATDEMFYYTFSFSYDEETGILKMRRPDGTVAQAIVTIDGNRMYLRDADGYILSSMVRI